MTVCRDCDGDGIVIAGWDDDAYQNIEKPCETCGGTGQVTVEKTSTKPAIRYRVIGDNEFGFHSVRVAQFNGHEGFWSTITASCSGCTESNEGDLSSYGYDEKAGCHVGNGCHECGYTGKRRQTFFTRLSELEA